MASTANNAGRVNFWRSPDLKGLETCRVFESRHIFPNHAHENIYAVGLMEKGGSYCLGEEKKELAVHPGQCCLLNPGQVHSGVPVGRRPITYRMLYLDIDLVRSAAGDVQEKETVYPEFKKIVIRDAPLYSMLMKVCRLSEQPGGRLEKESLLLETLGCLLSEYGDIMDTACPTGGHLRAVQQAKDLMAANLDQKLTLEEIANSAGLSRYHFLRIFKRSTGLSPHLYRTLKRLDMAKERLREGHPAAEVALESGFVDQSHLTNKFRQLLGVTPGQYLASQ